MTDREALVAALAEHFSLRDLDEHDTVDAAARERLAQLPETCGTCLGQGIDHDYSPCPTCHGSGKVYPAELRERLRPVINWRKSMMTDEDFLVAVLDALNGATDAT